MPTTANEAQLIIAIAHKHFPDIHRLHDMFVELDDQVGRASENDSVKSSFAMFRLLIKSAYHRSRSSVDTVVELHDNRSLSNGEAEKTGGASGAAGVSGISEPVPAGPQLAAMAVWLTIVCVHHALIVGNLASVCVLPFMVPWYLALPVCSSVAWGVCSPMVCILTRWDNYYRRQLGRAEIRGFVGHHYVGPLRRLFNGRQPA